MGNQKRYLKKSYKQDVFFIFFIAAFESILYPVAAKGDVLSIALFALFFIGLLILILGLIPQRIWVLVDEKGVSFHNVFRQIEVPWDEISHCYTFTLYFMKVTHLRCLDGKTHAIPITGSQAKEISEHINNKIASNAT
ncbi:hypothetical protein [Neptuniibacter sp.]|uniref:hypothetical protein n=1 Tax=Neptuniibacter sp. TaxID=1962643 RepID=UPI002618B301|nr:hypothetical protein [Neptuniibacter sp.]MCP4596336.1 hypothetical protein [Neptuniibacter sp.]